MASHLPTAWTHLPASLRRLRQRDPFGVLVWVQLDRESWDVWMGGVTEWLDDAWIMLQWWMDDELVGLDR